MKFKVELIIFEILIMFNQIECHHRSWCLLCLLMYLNYIYILIRFGYLNWLFYLYFMLFYYIFLLVLGTTPFLLCFQALEF
jgi:hypothetical protein